MIFTSLSVFCKVNRTDATASCVIVLIPENRQLTTQRASDLLGISRPHLIKLLEAGELPYHKAGSNRRHIIWRPP